MVGERRNHEMKTRVIWSPEVQAGDKLKKNIIISSQPVWDSTNAQQNLKSLDYNCSDEAAYIIVLRGELELLRRPISLP